MTQVEFPKDGFATPAQLASLEKILPARDPLPAPPAEAEEVTLERFDADTEPGVRICGQSHPST